MKNKWKFNNVILIISVSAVGRGEDAATDTRKHSSSNVVRRAQNDVIVKRMLVRSSYDHEWRRRLVCHVSRVAAVSGRCH